MPGADPSNNILITFEADPSGIAPGVEGLQHLGKVDANLADSFNKTNDALKQRQKLVDNSGSSLQSYIQDLLNVQKATVGAFGIKGLQDFEKQVGSTTNSTKLLQSALSLAKQNLDKFKPNTPEWEQLNSAIQQGEVFLKTFGATTQTTGTKTANFLTQLRQMRYEMQQMEAAGLGDTEAFKSLSKQAAELESGIERTQTRVHALASETVNIDALVQGVGALSAGFEVAAGVTALLGGNEEDLQKTLVKLNAVMAISNGIAQIQNAIKEQSILKIKLESLAEYALNFIRTGSFKAIKQNVAATEEDIAVKEADAVATAEVAATTTAASFALQAFRVALLATGIGAIVVALGFLITELSDFVSHTKEAKAAEEEFNAAIKEGGEFLDAEIQGLNDYNEKVIAVLKARNASDNTISKQEISNLESVQAARQRALDNNVAKMNDEEKMNNLSAESFQKLADQQISLQNDIATGEVQLLQKRSDLQVKYFQDSLKNEKSFADARAVIASQSTGDLIKLRDAEIAAAKTDAATELANANLTAGEIFKIHADLQKKILDINRQTNVGILQQQKNYADADVVTAVDGTEKKLVAQLKALQIQHDIDIILAGDDASKKEKIDKEYFQNKLDLNRKTSLAIAQDAQNTHIGITSDFITNLQLQGMKDTDDEIIEAKKRLIDQQADLEVLGVQNSVHNEQLRNVKIKEIYDKALLDKKSLEDAKTKIEIDSALSAKQQVLAIQKSELDEGLNLIGSFGPARAKLDAEITQNALSNIQAQKDAALDSLNAQIINFQEYQQKIIELNNQTNQVLEESNKATLERKIAFEDAAAQQITQISDSIFQRQIDNLQNEQSANQDLLNNKVISQNEYNKRQALIAKQQSAIKKEQALVDIFIEAAKKIFEIEALAALYTASLNPIGAAAALSQIPVVLVEEGIAAAFIAAQKFKTGKVKIDGPGTETSDSIFALLSKNESVINAEATKRYEPALHAMNELRFEDYIVKNFPHFDFPVMNDVPEWAYSSQTEIDYDKLGAHVAKHIGKIADIPQAGLSFDENGVRLWMKKQDALDIYLNKKYGYKRS